MFSEDIFDLKFRNPLGAGAESAPRRRPSLFGRSAACAFMEIGPLAYSKEGGIRAAVSSLMRYKPYNQLIALSISKLESSDSEDRVRLDYLSGFTYAYDFADFFVLDFSDGENSPYLAPDFVEGITDPILDARLSYEESKPLILKLSPKLPASVLEDILHYCLMNGVDGVEVSGTEAISRVVEFSKGRLPVIAFGTFSSAEEVFAALGAGASLVNLGQCRGRHASRILKRLKTLNLSNNEQGFDMHNRR